MATAGDRIEQARTLLQGELERSSIRAVAERVGIDHTTLRAFTMPGGVKRPKAKVLEPILAYAAKRLGSEGSPPPADGPPSVRPGEPVVTLPATLAAYWRGRVEEQVNTLHGVSRTLEGVTRSTEALLQLLVSTTRGLDGFLGAGVLPPVRHSAHGEIVPVTPEQEAAAARRMGFADEAADADGRRSAGGS